MAKQGPFSREKIIIMYKYLIIILAHILILEIESTFISNHKFPTLQTLPRNIANDNLPSKTLKSIPDNSYQDLQREARSSNAKRVKFLEPSIKEKQKTKQKIQDPKLWRVILHNDEIHSFEYVTQCITRVINWLTLSKAYDITIQAHSNDMSTIVVVWKNIAEHYCLNLQKVGLTVSIVPDSYFVDRGVVNDEKRLVEMKEKLEHSFQFM